MKALIAEDELVSRRLLERTLAKWGYEVESAEDGLKAWECLQSQDAPRLAILDWMMPGLDGPDICRKVRERADAPYTYIILLTAKSSQDDVVMGLEAGADDYLTKPFNIPELRVRLRAGRRILDLQQNLIRAQESLRAKATHDPLTGLLNRAGIMDILDRELHRASRQGSWLAVMMSDLDHFKRVNDTFGHLGGDGVLREAAQRMLRDLRPFDALGRYGGEEFLVVVPGCDTKDALMPAERLRRRIEEKPINTSEGMISVTMSIGVVAARGPDQQAATALLRAADQALYQAKEEGRNRVVLGSVESAATTGLVLPGEPKIRTA